jgi:hypothetical protein
MKNYYIIRQESRGRGLFSLLSAVICNIDFAIKNKLIPIVDFQNYTTEYNEKDPIGNTTNAYEYYFQPLMGISLEDAYKGQIILSDNTYPKGYNYSIGKMPWLFSAYSEHIKLNAQTQDYLSQQLHLINGNTVGVHYRGQEAKTAAGHWYPPSKKQITTAINNILKPGQYKNIFVVTEDTNHLHFLQAEYGSLVKACNHFRTKGENGYHLYPRDNHKYLLGLEVLADAMLLSQCQALVGCTSNVAEFARFANNHQYSDAILINNGSNSKYPRVAAHTWRIKNLLPANFGGFKINPETLIHTKNSSLKSFR